MIADSLWLHLLPDIDTIVPKPANKANTWQYEVINTVTDLAPHFRTVYRSGGDVLSVVLDDREGATKIFEKGLGVFPTYWPLLYSAAYHFMEEEKNPKKAAELLLVASQNGGPEWFISLAGKLYSESGQKDLAIRSLLDYLKRFPKAEGRERVLERLKALGVTPDTYSN
ncbi:MAG: hypothetical protein KDD37_05035 [Bdellovibrionales bacterium]|nr:hypothetical protein [Bdellovibrionales bacterium]